MTKTIVFQSDVLEKPNLDKGQDAWLTSMSNSQVAAVTADST